MNISLLGLYQMAQSRLRGKGLLRNRALRAAHHWTVRNLTKSLRPGIYKINGYPVYLDAANLPNGLQTEIEPELVNYAKSILNPGDVVLDIGANIGVITVPCAHFVGPSGRVISFEPDFENSLSLRRNIILNNLSNVDIVEKAASSSTGIAQLTLSDTSGGGHSMLPVPSDSPLYRKHATHATVPVSTTTVDEWIDEAKIAKIDFVKIDVEGYEISVLKGMRHCLQRNHGIRVVMEYTPNILIRGGIPIEEPLRYMMDLGFEFFLLATPIKPVTFHELTELGEAGVNLLCQRPGRLPL